MDDSIPNALPVASPSAAPPTRAAQRPTARFCFSHPAHAIALGFGSGLSPIAPGTAGTLWAWVAFGLLYPLLSDVAWAALIGVGLVLGWWAATVTAQHLGVADPSCVVWDEIIAFWLILWLVMPTGFWGQLVAFGLFRFFDAAKPGPVGWADAAFKGERGGAIGARQGFGILFDDVVAALCTLFVIALWRFVVKA